MALMLVLTFTITAKLLQFTPVGWPVVLAPLWLYLIVAVPVEILYRRKKRAAQAHLKRLIDEQERKRRNNQ